MSISPPSAAPLTQQGRIAAISAALAIALGDAWRTMEVPRCAVPCELVVKNKFDGRNPSITIKFRRPYHVVMTCNSPGSVDNPLLLASHLGIDSHSNLGSKDATIVKQFLRIIKREDYLRRFDDYLRDMDQHDGLQEAALRERNALAALFGAEKLSNPSEADRAITLPRGAGTVRPDGGAVRFEALRVSAGAARRIAAIILEEND